MVFIQCSALEILHNCCINAFRRDATQFLDTRSCVLLCGSVNLLCLKGLEHFLQRVSSSALYFHCEHENLSFSETTKKKTFPIELSLVKENLLGLIISLGTEEMAQ